MSELHKLPAQGQPHQLGDQAHQHKQLEAQPQGGPIGPVQGRNAQGEPTGINLPESGGALRPINLPERVRDKFEALKAMNTVVNDESFYYERLFPMRQTMRSFWKLHRKIAMQFVVSSTTSAGTHKTAGCTSAASGGLTD